METHDELLVQDEAKLRLLFFGRGTTLVMIDPKNNHYKFWNIQKVDDAHYKTSYGRIGKRMQTSEQIAYGQIDYAMNVKIRDKKKKGYIEL